MQKRRRFYLFFVILLIMILPLTFAAQTESHSYIRANGKIVADNFNNGTTTQLYYYHYDALGNLVSITDSQGKVVESQRVEAFGNELQKTKSVDVTDRSFIGKEKDSNDLFYFGARYYDANTGRFISTDPLSGKQTSPQSQNKYTYAVNNPLKYVDLNGKSTDEIDTSGIGEVIQVPGAATATAYYADLANQPELWKQAVGQTGGFFSSLGMNPLKTTVALLGGYGLSAVATAPATVAVASTGTAATGTALTATELAVTTGGAAIAGETIQLATQVAPEVSAPIIAQTTTAIAEIAPIAQALVQRAPQTMQATKSIGPIAPNLGNVGSIFSQNMAELQQIVSRNQVIMGWLDTAVKTKNLPAQKVVADIIIQGY